MTPITGAALVYAGWQVVHWNPNFEGGGWFEYRKAMGGADDEHGGGRVVAVRFDRDPRYGRDYMVYVASVGAPAMYIALWNVTTMEGLRALVEAVTGGVA